jgi:adenosine/AMP kinase
VQGRGDPVRGVRVDVGAELVLDLERVLVGDQPERQLRVAFASGAGRRLVSEGRANILRALRARQADIAAS